MKKNEETGEMEANGKPNEELYAAKGGLSKYGNYRVIQKIDKQNVMKQDKISVLL